MSTRRGLVAADLHRRQGVTSVVLLGAALMVVLVTLSVGAESRQSQQPDTAAEI